MSESPSSDMAKANTANGKANGGHDNLNGGEPVSNTSVAARSTAVYVQDDETGWRPAELLHPTEVDHRDDDNFVSVRLLALPGEERLTSSSASSASSGSIVRVDLREYENNSLPLRDLDGDGDDASSSPLTREDMCNLPHPHEASILHNLRGRHVHLREPYTRAGVVGVVAVNPFVWMDHLYTPEVRRRYATDLVWRPPRPRSGGKETGQQPVPPHVYEASALAYRGLLVDGTDQSILVSGETGAGKTETVKILMVHLATMESTRCPGALLEGDEEKEENEGDDSSASEVLKKRRRLLLMGGRGKSMMMRAVSFRRTPPTSTSTGRGLTKGLASFRSLRNLSPSPSSYSPSSPRRSPRTSGGSYDEMREMRRAKLLRDTTGTSTGSSICSPPSSPASIPEEDVAGMGSRPPPPPPPLSDRTWSPSTAGKGVEGHHDHHHHDHHHHEVVRRVLDANPLLEAFGNAQTSRNDNSSRFSRYTRLQFHAEGSVSAGTRRCTLAGSVCETYLLEKSRVVRRPGGERTFHVFYNFLRGASGGDRTRVWDEGLSGGADVSSFRYLADGCGEYDGGIATFTSTSTSTSSANADSERWEEVVNALDDVGIRDEKFVTLFRAICTVLQLGNVVLAPKDPHDDDEHGPCAVPPSSRGELDKLSSLLGVPVGDLEEALTSKTVTVPTPRSSGSNAEGKEEEVLRVPLTAGDAMDGRDALAKEVYSMAFDWLVRAINDATSAERNYDRRGEMEMPALPTPEEGFGGEGNNFAIVGLLDIFGFETFDVNGFEQLCINHANERLQRRFVRDVFVSVGEECMAEGIELPCDVTAFDDDDGVLGLVEGRMGLIDLLNEECVRPRGNDAGFVNKLYRANRTAKQDSGLSLSSSSFSPLFQKRGFRNVEFGVRHYAGSVVYNAVGFVAKNTDGLPRGLMNCALRSTNDLIRTELSCRMAARLDGDTKKGSLVATTVWTKFRRQLVGLMDDIGNTRTRYVRCIVPNRSREPGVMDMNFTLRQLRCAGIVNAITLSRSFFPNKMLLTTAVDRFGFLARTGRSGKDLRTRGGHSGNSTALRNETDCLLRALLAGWEDPTAGKERTEESASAFVCGKTRVYFRAGALEFLEAERLRAFDAVATVIQCRYRQSAAKVRRRRLMIERETSLAVVANTRRRKGKFSRLKKKMLIVSLVARKSGRWQQGTTRDASNSKQQLLRPQ